MERIYRIALAFPHEHGTVRGLYKGILEYAQDFPLFTFRHTGPNDLHGVEQLTSWTGDGAIVSLNSPHSIEIADTLQCPVVNISGAFEQTGHTRVLKDHFGVGRSAAEHLAATGVTAFGYIGINNRWYSDQKFAGFQSFLKNTGYPIHYIFVDKIEDLEGEEKAFESIRDWLDGLSAPVGILLDTDALYGILNELCIERGWSIPEDLPVIGINNFSAICLTRSPSLSSIEYGDRKYGYTAMKTLHDLIVNRSSKKPEDVIIQGHKIFARQSTAFTFVDNPKLNEAIKFIRANLSKFFSMEDVIAVTNCSRRWLETAFKNHLKTTPANYIQSLRIQKARQLIADYPKLDLHEVARSCGFSSKRHMDDVFRKVENIDPSEL
ncbi:substrate-binding domain-containing protein [Puniceicoccales bacterium CK1056]|uniref:Substrate-binding domain-containing protein n=1 Tax=Oceanipulchritudo coccoides TaxID=2706888 RepID=A0A6B2LYH1_9BACT|nr:substrate-binding domain-containing protein [Oceanipulchritudo coccoides]NDV61721.1 substrate-binding domain-containing protein [Oceanipulchritudo coccoides]